MRPGRRRWLIIAALFGISYGLSTPLVSYGVFLPILAETFGWSRGAISTALSMNLLLGGLTGFWVGRFADRAGPRVPFVLTAVLGSASFALMSTVGALWQLYLFVGVLGGVGTSSYYLLTAATVVRWFEERRGLALGLGLLGFHVSYISAGPLTAWLIAALGWREAAALLGVVCGLVSVLAAITVRLPREAEIPARPRPASAGAAAVEADPGMTLAEALADVRLWCLAGTWVLQGATALMFTVHVVPFSHDRGISLAAASFALTAYGFGAVSGRIVAGALSDRISARTMARIGYVLQILALLAVFSAPSRDVLLAALFLVGAGFAAVDLMITRIVPDVFGVRALGAIMGVLSLGWRFGAAAGPAAAGFLYDLTGAYTIPFGVAPLAVLTSWGLLIVSSAPRRRRVASAVEQRP